MAAKSKKIKQDPHNANIHDDANLALIEKSLTELGAGRSILLDKEGYIIAGNGVEKKADELGLPIKIIETDGKTLIAVKRTYLAYDDERRRALAVADNAIAKTSTFDFEELTEDEVAEWNIDVPNSLTGGSHGGTIDDDFQYPDEEDAKKSHVRMVQLFLNSETEPVLRDYCTSLEQVFGTDNLTDTVFAAVEWAAKNAGNYE